MNSKNNFIPIQKVLSVINSCETMEQLKNCLPLIESYTSQIKHRGVINSELAKKRLIKEYKQKKFQINMISTFIISQRKVFYANVELVA